MKKIKYFVFSDVHGEYNALIKSLEEAGYQYGNPDNKLISIGDAFDRGPHSRKVYDLLCRENAIAIKGNHDVMFQEYLEKGMDGEFVLFNILHNGLCDTIHSFTGLENKNMNYKSVDQARKQINWGVLEWIKKMPLYFETQHMIFCHAGIDPSIPNWKDTEEDFMLWDIEHSHEPIHSTEKLVIIGHHHAFRVRENGEAVGLRPLNPNGDMVLRISGSENSAIKFYGNTDENAPYVYGNKVALDGCTNLTHKVNVMVVEDYPMEEEKPKVTEPSDNPNINGKIYVNNEGITYATYNPDWGTTMEATVEAMNRMGAVFTTTTVDTTTNRW